MASPIVRIRQSRNIDLAAGDARSRLGRTTKYLDDFCFYNKHQYTYLLLTRSHYEIMINRNYNGLVLCYVTESAVVHMLENDDHRASS